MSSITAAAAVRGRLDKALRAAFPSWARRDVDEAISSRRVAVNGRTVWLGSWQVEPGDELVVLDPPSAKPVFTAIWDDGWLVHVDENLVVVNKPSGLRSEPRRAGDADASLLTICAQKFGALTLAHRLDRDTSGLVVLARTTAARRTLDAAFKEHAMAKHYVAVVGAHTELADEGTIDERLAPDPRRRDAMVVVERGGDSARTRYRVRVRDGRRVLLDLWPETGRTHQLRLHCVAIGAPILGDRLYGDATSAPRLMLHAYELLVPAIVDGRPRTLTAPLPDGFVPTTSPELGCPTPP